MVFEEIMSPRAKGTNSPYNDPALNPTSRVSMGRRKEYDIFGNLIGGKRRRKKRKKL